MEDGICIGWSWGMKEWQSPESKSKENNGILQNVWRKQADDSARIVLDEFMFSSSLMNCIMTE